jgi:8-oxo-dGTP pyrophosphatase MutT (NUDIX family)
MVVPDLMRSIEHDLRARLARGLPGPDVLWRFAVRPPRGNWDPAHIPQTARPAAALLLLYPLAAQPHFLLTERHSNLPHHPGQISFPGGRVDAGEGLQDAALREAHEEVGVAAGGVRMLGALSPVFVPVSNFAIHPFVGVSDARPSFAIAPREVEALIEVPLDDLRRHGPLSWATRTRETQVVEYPYFTLAGRHVWGATAMILGEFACLFDADFGGARS